MEGSDEVPSTVNLRRDRWRNGQRNQQEKRRNNNKSAPQEAEPPKKLEKKDSEYIADTDSLSHGSGEGDDAEEYEDGMWEMTYDSILGFIWYDDDEDEGPGYDNGDATDVEKATTGEANNNNRGLRNSSHGKTKSTEKKMSKKERRRRRRRRRAMYFRKRRRTLTCCIIFMPLILFLSLALAHYVFMGKNSLHMNWEFVGEYYNDLFGKNDNNDEVVSDTANVSDRYSKVKEFVITSGMSDESDLEYKMTSSDTVESPQLRALKWIADEDLLQLPIPHNETNEEPMKSQLNQFKERYALAVLFYSADMSETKFASSGKWMSPVPYCDWAGIKCQRGSDDEEEDRRKMNDVGADVPDAPMMTMQKVEQTGPNPIESVEVARNQRVSILNLTLAGVGGELPKEISILTALKSMDLSRNSIAGTLPEEIFNDFSGLEEIRLEANRFEGPIPETIGNSKKLVHLNLSRNQFKGAIPASIANLSSLGYLNLRSNMLEGPIDPRIGKLAKLERLFMHYNEIFDTMPQSICDLRKTMTHSVNSNGQGILMVLSADCGGGTTPKVKCDCCTHCF